MVGPVRADVHPRVVVVLIRRCRGTRIDVGIDRACWTEKGHNTEIMIKPRKGFSGEGTPRNTATRIGDELEAQTQKQSEVEGRLLSGSEVMEGKIGRSGKVRPEREGTQADSGIMLCRFVDIGNEAESRTDLLFNRC